MSKIYNIAKQIIGLLKTIAVYGILIICLFLVNVSFAQTTQLEHERQKVVELSENLELSPAVSEKFGLIMSDHGKNMLASMSKYEGDLPALRKAIKIEQVKLDESVKELLTADQFDKYRLEIKTIRKERRKAYLQNRNDVD